MQRSIYFPLLIYQLLHSFLIHFPLVNHTELFIDLKLSSVLCDRALYSWGGRDLMRKVIVLSSCFPEVMDSEARNTLMVSQNTMSVGALACYISTKSFFASGCSR